MADSANIDRESLIRRFRSGDTEAFRVLVDADAPRVRQRIERQLPPWLARRVSVSDLVQDACVVAFRRREDFCGDDAEAFRRWLYGIAQMNARRAVQHHAGKARRSCKREVTRGQFAESVQFPGGDGSPSQFAIAAETKERIQRALQELSPDHREVLALVREERLSLREVADRMGRSYPAVKKLHGRALLRFAEAFKRLQGGCDD